MALSTRYRLPLFLTLSSLVVAAGARNSAYFDRRICRDEIIALQKQPGFSMNGPEYFLQDPLTGKLKNESDDMTLTLRGCEELCGPMSFYWDAFPRITTWIIPVLLILSNVELSPIDKNRFLTIVHALGDPIDSFWSIIHKIYIWHRLYQIGLQKSSLSLHEQEMLARSFRTKLFELRLAVFAALATVWRRVRRSKVPNPEDHPQRERGYGAEQEDELTRDHRARIIATVLSGFEEISGAKIVSENYYHMITHKLGRIGEDGEDPAKFEQWRCCARILADARTNEFLRTCLSIFVYIFGLIAAFVPAVGGGNTSPPGGRIGSALFLSWLVPMALLSNRVGTFASRRACLHIMRQFVMATRPPPDPASPIVHRASDASGASPTRAFRRYDLGGAQEEISTARAARTGSDARAVSPMQPSVQSFRGDALGTRAPGLDKWGKEVLDAMATTNDGPVKRATDAGAGLLPQVSVPERERTVSFSVDEADLGTSSFTPLLPEHRQARAKAAFDDGMELRDWATGSDKGKPPREPVAAEAEVDGDPSQTGLIDLTSWDDYFSALQWLGAIYTYRPWKVQYLDIDPQTHAHRNSIGMAFAGFLPVLVSTVGAFVILWYSVPEGFSCRHIWNLGIFLTWIFSATFTTVLYVRSSRKSGGGSKAAHRGRESEDNSTGRRLWSIILIKDAIIGTLSLVIIFLSTGGVFNNCYCWSAYMAWRQNAYVPLDTDSAYGERALKIYSVVVGTCLGAHILFFIWITWRWRMGLRLVRWPESQKRREWRHELQPSVLYTEDTFLLFWYEPTDLERMELARQGRFRRYSEVQAARRFSSVAWPGRWGVLGRVHTSRRGGSR